MRQTFRVWGIVAFMILAMVIQMNLMADADASKYVKEDLDFAVHDAAMLLDQSKLADAKIVFDKDKAYAAFKNSLELNAHLTSDSPTSGALTPTEESFFQNDFQVLTFEVIDDSNSTFPCLYQHPLYKMGVLYSGPTIVAIVKTWSPRYFRGNRSLVRKAASYTYKESGEKDPNPPVCLSLSGP